MQASDDLPGVVSIGRIASILDSAAKALVVLSLVSYSVGLLVTNFRLRKYGIVQMEALRTEYVMTGIVWLILSVLGFVVVYEIRSAMSYVASMARGRRGVALAVPLLLGLMLVAGIGSFSVMVLGTFGFENAWEFGPTAIRAALVLIVCAAAHTYIFGLFTPGPVSHMHNRLRTEPLLFSRDLLATIGLVAAYALFVYPYLPGMFGGGARPVVRLVAGRSEPRAATVARDQTLRKRDRAGTSLIRIRRLRLHNCKQ